MKYYVKVGGSLFFLKYKQYPDTVQGTGDSGID